jgi:hypothetical protein
VGQPAVKARLDKEKMADEHNLLPPIRNGPKWLAALTWGTYFVTFIKP